MHVGQWGSKSVPLLNKTWFDSHSMEYQQKKVLRKIISIVFVPSYSHLSHKRDATLTDFGESPLQIYWFHYRTFNILTEPNDDFSDGLYSSSKIDRKSPVDFATFAPLHVYSNLHG